MDTVRQITVPPTTRALITLPQVDYADAFTLDIDGARERTGEQWARATLGSASPHALRPLLWLFSAIGMQLGPIQSERFVVGWEIRRSTPEFALLAAGSPRIGLSAELLFKADQQTLLFATFLRLKTPIARAVWAGLAPVHRRVVRNLLTGAGRTVQEEGAGSGPPRAR